MSAVGGAFHTRRACHETPRPHLHPLLGLRRRLHAAGRHDGVAVREPAARGGEVGVSEAVEFLAEVVKVQTLADHGLRVTLDLSEDEVIAAAKLMEFKRHGVAVKVRVEAE